MQSFNHGSPSAWLFCCPRSRIIFQAGKTLVGRLGGVVPFEEVWSRSYCRSRETLVDVLSEFPHEAEHVFKPPCVPLRRCAGCCGDESLECVAVETRTVVVRVSPIQGLSRQEEMRFTEHGRCVCR
uniref:Platelet-derived growth factor (PDGF) family profile domain-containing protein n=1 Tax=Sphenodon punctatus TaxID=8508 RepID=A0A8D0GVT1_SPHPU